MTETIGTIPERAFLVSIPVADLGLGLGLSPIATLGVDRAVAMISHLICE